MRRRSADEAYRFEREAEREPFLYEAMEGLEDMLASDIQQSLDELDDRLDEKEKMRLPFTWQQAAAVAAVVVVGASLFFLIRPSNNEMDSTAEEDYTPRSGTYSPSNTDEEDAFIGTESDSVPTEKTEDVEVAASFEEAQVVVPVPNRAVEPTLEIATIEDDEIGDDLAIASETIQDEVEDAAGMAFEQAEPARSKALSAESIASDEAPGFTREAIDKSNVKKAPAEMNKSTAQSNTASKPQPEGGMTGYQRYIKSNLRATESMPSGKVVITFEFEKDGTPKKMNVQQSLCTACDAEAKRLIQNGPKWKAEDRKERVSVEIKFP